MNPTVVIWILAVAVAVLVGREVGKWLFGVHLALHSHSQECRHGADTL